MGTIRVLSPVGVDASEAFTAPALPRALAGLTVGFLDNTKPNFDLLADALGTLLSERHGAKAIVHRRKANVSNPAAPEILAEIAKACDLVFAGSGD